jgi:protein-disulfide isomerase
MPKILRPLTIALSLVLAFAGIAAAAEFNDKQADEIRAIVKQYLIDHPEVIQEALRANEERQQRAEDERRNQALQSNASDIFRSGDDLVAGNSSGSVTMVEFFDYNCGYCKRAFPDVMKMIQADGDLKLVMKEFPILGPGSVYAARAALASRKQDKYWEYHLALLGHDGRIDEATADEIARSVGLDVAKLKTDMKSDDVTRVIQRNMMLAEALRIEGTPAFIIDDVLIPGAVGFDALAATVKSVRDQGGCKVC